MDAAGKLFARYPAVSVEGSGCRGAAAPAPTLQLAQRGVGQVHHERLHRLVAPGRLHVDARDAAEVVPP